MKHKKMVRLSAAMALLALLAGLAACGGAPAAGGSAQPAPAAPGEGQAPGGSVPQPAQSPVAQPPVEQPSGSLEGAVTQEVQIPAPALAGNLVGTPEQQGIMVWLPPGYAESGKQYPVIYYLPGYTEDYRQAMQRFDAGMTARAAAGEAPDVIVVTVNGINCFGGSFYANSPVTGNWQDFVVRDVVDYVDANYRTLKDPAARGLTGHSMGGAGTVNIVMERPGVFGWAYAMSPAIFGDGGFEQSGTSLETVLMLRNHYAAMQAEDLGHEYIADVNGGVWNELLWTMAYGSAFVGDATIGPPWIQLPAGSPGAWQNDAALQRYYNGVGGFAARVPAAAGNLRQLKGLMIDYGRQDELAWIPVGCEALAAQLAANGIAHVLQPYDGTHGDQIDRRVAEVVLPFFMKGFAGG